MTGTSTEACAPEVSFPECAHEAGDARRRLAATLAISALVHLAILVSQGDAGGWQAQASRLVALTVRYEGPAEAGTRAPETPAATDLPRAETSLAPAAETEKPAAPPMVAGPLAEAVTGTVAEVTPEPRAAALPVIATPGESERAGPAEATAAAARAEPRPPARPPEAFVRRIGEWIHELESTDPRRAELSWQQDGRSYTAVLTPRAAGDATDLERYDVEIISPDASGRWATGLSFRRLAFSHFTQFVDRWDHDVQLHDDEIAGRFHANSSIIIGFDRQAAPRFLGKVTTAGHGFRIADAFGRRRREDIFQGGLETGVERIRLPPRPQPFESAAEPTGGYRRLFEHDARIRFHADGSFSWSGLRRDSAWQLERPSGGPVYLLAATGAELRVSGTVRGQVLVYSPAGIVIEGDLRYARDPRIEPAAEDLLGLVTAGHVEIAPPFTTGRGDLEIHAAIFASRRFVVAQPEAPRAGTLRIFGSLTAGSLSETEPRYATRIDFDPRLEQRRPPGFPLAPRFELEAADSSWRLHDGPRPH